MKTEITVGILWAECCQAAIDGDDGLAGGRHERYGGSESTQPRSRSCLAGIEDSTRARLTPSFWLPERT